MSVPGAHLSVVAVVVSNCVCYCVTLAFFTLQGHGTLSGKEQGTRGRTKPGAGAVILPESVSSLPMPVREDSSAFWRDFLHSTAAFHAGCTAATGSVCLGELGTACPLSGLAF